MSKKDSGIYGQFVPLHHAMLDAPAWCAMSHGARSLYIALRRRVPRGRNQAFLSYRQAEIELRSSRRKIAEWFKELEYYGFLVLASHGCLGVDGKGKSPHWRLTELGTTSKTSPEGLPEPPTRDYLSWEGGRWRRSRKQNPGSYVGNDAVPTSETPPVPTSETLKPETVSHGVAIRPGPTVSHGVAISSYHYGGLDVANPRVTALSGWGVAAKRKPKSARAKKVREGVTGSSHVKADPVLPSSPYLDRSENGSGSMIKRSI